MHTSWFWARKTVADWPHHHTWSGYAPASGVPQGSVLGPLLFLCYINDVTSGISSAIKLYTDDVLIYRVVNCIDNCKMLQRCLDTLQAWAHKWNMSFNSAKCDFL